jgi:acetyl-CoA synthetase
MRVIHKTAEDWRVSPNLIDYERTRAAFHWSTSPNPCVGMPSDRCNIAFAAVDRHVDGPIASRSAAVRVRARIGRRTGHP